MGDPNPLRMMASRPKSLQHFNATPSAYGLTKPHLGAAELRLHPESALCTIEGDHPDFTAETLDWRAMAEVASQAARPASSLPPNRLRSRL